MWRNPLENLYKPLLRGSKLFLCNGVARRIADSLEFLHELQGSIL